MKREELRERIYKGECLSDMFNFIWGQDCTIYKGEWNPDDEIIYIPDIDLYGICINRSLITILTKDEIDEMINSCFYTGKDFMELCDNNEELAKELFDYVDWQSPSGAYNEVKEAYEDRQEEKEIEKVIDNIKSYLLNCNYNNNIERKIYHDLFSLYEKYNSCIVSDSVDNLAKELIDGSEYEATSKVLHEFNIVCEVFRIG